MVGMGGLEFNITILFFMLLVAVAFLYASVGHGGASGYIALMSLFSFPIIFIKPAALVLNIFISGISFWFFKKQKHFKWSLFYPFALTSIPAAFLGGYLDVNTVLYRQVLGVLLLLATLRILGFFGRENKTKRPLKKSLALIFGLGIGFFSGMIGIGGGIVLSPLLLLLGWADLKESAAVSALFILVNSSAGLLGYTSSHSLGIDHFYLVPKALIGGVLGAKYGSGSFPNYILRYTLSVVLIIACVKLTFL